MTNLQGGTPAGGPAPAKARRIVVPPWLILAAVLCPWLVSCGSLIAEKYGDPKQEIIDKTAADSKWVKPPGGEFVIKRDWWQAMGDPALDQLIGQATTDNIDLKVLVGRVGKAELELTGAKSDQWPKLSATGGYSDTRTMRYSQTTDTVKREFFVGTGLSWELDLWGKLEQKKEAQWAAYQASEADWRACYLTLIAGLTNAYFSARQLDEQRQLHHQAIATAEEVLKLYRRRQQEGVESGESINNQQAEILRLKRELNELDRQRQVTVNELAFLLGKPAGNFSLPDAALRRNVKLIGFPKELNANLLERRPDIVAAELRVRQAYHLQEASRAARMPSVSIGLNIDMANAAMSALAQNWTATIMPSITFPFLDPNTTVQLKLSEADVQEGCEYYKKTVLNAIKEVENALINLRSHLEQLDLEQQRAAELQTAREKVQVRLKEGVISQLEVFENERSLLDANQKGLELYATVLQDTVTLYNALGGGWQ